MRDSDLGAVIFNGEVGLGITVHTDVANTCYGNETEKTVYHAKTCAENGNDSKLLARNSLLHALANGGLDFHVLGGEISCDFISHQHGYLVKELLELACGGVLHTHDGQLVLNKGVLNNLEFAHKSYFLSFI